MGLRPKFYSYVYEKNSALLESNTAKGVKKSVKNTKLAFADYEHSLRALEVKVVSMNSIRSDHHKLYSLTTKKVGLSAYDDKRSICADGVSTRAHGHWRV